MCSRSCSDSYFSFLHSFSTTQFMTSVDTLILTPGAKSVNPLGEILSDCIPSYGMFPSISRMLASFCQRANVSPSLRITAVGRWPDPQAWQVSGYHRCLACLPMQIQWPQGGVTLFTSESVRREMERGAVDREIHSHTLSNF